MRGLTTSASLFTGRSRTACLVLTVIGNTAANRRFTFLAHRNGVAPRDHLGGLAAFGIALSLTTLAIAGVHLLAPGASRTVELIVLTLANLVATTVRFLLLRAWITPASRGALPWGRVDSGLAGRVV